MSSTSKTLVAISALLPLLAACSATYRSAGRAGGVRTGRCAPTAPPSSVVARDELLRTHVPKLMEAIARLRPRFLERRGARRDQRAVVYVDGTPAGSIEELEEIPVADVVWVTFLRPVDATTRFGTDHVGGALLVRTRGTPGRSCPSD